MRKYLWLASLLCVLGLTFSCGGAPSICDEQKPCSGGKNCEDGICVCPNTKTDCNGSCVDQGTDNNNCGVCGNKCGKGKRCVSGKCKCGAGLKDCGICVDPNANVDHCGACNRKCKQGEVCTEGSCKTNCENGQTACSGSCVNLQNNGLNCGKCGSVCSRGQNCVQGKCECPAGTKKCGDSCVDLKTDRKHCGACDKVCASGQRCADANCSASCSKRNPNPCLGGCYNFQTSTKHCGKCGNECAGGKLCVSGICQCPSGRKDCNGKCIDVRISRAHCGECGNVCPSGNVCADGICRTSCPKSTEKICLGGCINVKSHPENCGECGKACRTGEVCKNELCGCPDGLTGCDKQCVDTKINVNHCGACNNICPSGEKCASGKCLKSCPASTPTDCNGSCVDTKTSVKNCGKCGITCEQGQSCKDGKCSCPKGLSLCNGLCVDLFKDPLNCGKCETKCPVRNKCVKTKDKNGKDIGQCQLDCTDDTLNTQCENQCVDVNTDIRHCGQCKNVCGGLKRCSAGKCACPNALSDCGGACVNLKADAKHCGKCDGKCDPGYKCEQSTCVLDCLKTETICGTTTKSCVDLQTDDKNCGKCGDVCPAGQFCTAGKCECPSGYTFCGGKCVDTEYTSDHCGSCGNACQKGAVCSKGKCQICSSSSGKICGSDCCPSAFDCCGTTTKACVDIRISNQHCGKCGNACPARQLCCGSACVKALSDNNNCGACGRKCASGETCCNGRCVNFKKDKLNCGSCGKRCGAGQSCCNGACADVSSSLVNCGACGVVCQSGETCCNGKCANKNTSASNCGACGKACASGESCCGGTCHNLTTSTTHCKSCGNSCSLGGQSGQSGCCGGACTNLSTDKANCGKCGTTCTTNSTCCGGACFDLQTNRFNCGTCGKQCSSFEQCCGGVCADLKTNAKNCGTCGKACSTGESCCGGGCIDLKKDPQNCGKCGVRCSSGQTCCNGVCADLKFDANHCGTCGKKCGVGNRCHLKICTKCQPSGREICDNNIDDNCDGNVDENCQKISSSLGITDYQRFSDGSTFVVHYRGSRLDATCYKADGTVKTNTFNVYGSGYRQEYPSVVTARKTNITVVTWINRGNSSSSSRKLFFRLYDGNCKPITGATNVPIVIGNNYVHATAMDQEGNFAIAIRNTNYQATIAFYDKAGKSQRAPMLADLNRVCKRNSAYGLQIAMNASGDGVLSCQGHQSDPIYFQRFSRNRALVGTAMTKITESQLGKSTWYVSHAIGINDRGEFAIQWQNGAKKTDEVIFYNADGSKRKHLVLGAIPSVYHWDGFKYVNQNIGIYKNDFILRQTPFRDNEPYKLLRYNRDGKLMSAVEATNYGRFFFRTWTPPPGCTGSHCNPVVCGRKGNTLYCGGFSLETNQGICNNSICSCTPYLVKDCYDGGTTNSLKQPCKMGYHYCKADGTGFSSCFDQTLPQPETCGNQKDDDCDGRTDESCSDSKSFDTIGTVQAMGAFSSGGLVTIHWNQIKLRGSCFNPNTSTKVGDFEVSEFRANSVSLVSVRVSQSSNKFVVSWVEHGQNNKNLYRSRLFDGNCKAITGVITHFTSVHRNGRLDAAIDDNGRFVVVARSSTDSFAAKMFFFDSNGKLLKGNVLLDPTHLKCNRGLPEAGLRVALNPRTGDGVVTCQSREYKPIYYRRFRANATFVDSTMVLVQGTDQYRSGYYDTHITGMNRKGEFVIQYHNFLSNQFEANFYNAAGTFVKKLSLGNDFVSRINIFWGPHAISLIGDDFVLLLGSRFDERRSPGQWLRFKSDGTLVSAGRGNTTQERDYYAIGGSNIFILRSDRRTVDLNPFSLAPGQGVCSGKPCLCKPGTKRDCYSASTSTRAPRSPCKWGTQTCQSNGLSWSACVGEVIPQPEKCGDKIDNNCDGTVDDNCPVSNYVENAQRFVSDYDVAESGQFVMINFNGKSIFANCYNANLTPKSSTLVVSTPGRYTDRQTVRVAKNGQYFVVFWREAMPSGASLYRYTFRLYNSNCIPINSPTPISSYTSDYKSDIAISNSGQVAIVYWDSSNPSLPRIKFQYFSNTGKKIGQTQVVEPTGKKCNKYLYGIHVAMNPVDGNGIVTCQGNTFEAIHYRFFSKAGVLTGTEMIAHRSTTTRGTSSYNDSHVVGMNKKNEFVISWVNLVQRRHSADFFNSSGSLVKHIANIGNLFSSSSYGTHPFDYVNSKVELAGDDFILRDGGRRDFPVTWYRYKSNGTLVSKAVNTSSSYRRYTGRFGNNAFYVHNHRRVYKDLIKFK